MRTFYLLFVSFLIFTLVLSSCEDAEKPKIPVDPLIQERDSLLNIYGGNLPNQEFDYLKQHKLGSTSNIYLYGKRNGLFWLGIFESSEKLKQEFELDLDSEHRFLDGFYEIKAPSFLISSYELFDVFGSEMEEKEQDGIFSKSIIRLESVNNVTKFSTSYLSKNELTWMEFARVWKGGFLLEHKSFDADGINTTQYISTDFSENILWECRAPYSPPPGVLYFDEDFFLGLGQDFLIGFDYSICEMWSKEVIDFFPDSSCDACSSSIKLLNQIDDTITIEAKLNESIRKVVLVYRTGEVVSNEEL